MNMITGFILGIFFTLLVNWKEIRIGDKVMEYFRKKEREECKGCKERPTRNNKYVKSLVKRIKELEEEK